MEDIVTGPQVGDQIGDQMLEIAVQYAEEQHWDVCPGTWLVPGKTPPRCSCGDASCARPGGHPAHGDWEGDASSGASAVRRMWAKQPGACIVMPTGISFDVLDVSEVVGCLAMARMERMGVRLAPVACTPQRRLQFFVQPGVSAKVPDMLRRMGWAPDLLDLVSLGEGGHVIAPPSRTGQGAVLWARPPTTLNRWLPEAEELIGPLAYACGRESAGSRVR